MLLCRYKLELAGKSLPSLTHADKGKFGVVIFERLESYLNMDKWNRQLLDKYCRDYHVGIIAFARPDEPLVSAQVAPDEYVFGQCFCNKEIGRYFQKSVAQL